MHANLNINSQIKVISPIRTDIVDKFDLTAALDYYGSDKAKIDFYNKRGEPKRILEGYKAGTSTTSHQKNRAGSVVDHLFEEGFADRQDASRKMSVKPSGPRLTLMGPKNSNNQHHVKIG